MAPRFSAVLAALVAVLALSAAPAAQQQVDLPITFDDAGVDYTVTDFPDDGSVTTVLVTDPADPTNTVAQTVKGTGAPLWGGTTASTPAGLASPIPFDAANTTMSVRVYSPDAGIPVRLKVETAGDPTRSVETEATTTTSGTWETLVFDFANEASGTAAIDFTYVYDLASIFFNFGTDGAAAGEKTYLWEDVVFGGAVDTSPTLVECRVSPMPTIVGETATIDATLTNATGEDPTYAVDFGDGTMATGLPATHTYATLGMVTATIVATFNSGTDSCEIPVTVSEPGVAIMLPVTFDAAIDYELRDFAGADSEIVADPATAGSGGGNLVLRTIRTAGAALFAGTAIADVSGLAEPIPFAEGMTTMSLDVWTPVAGTPVRLKLETVGGGPTVEAQVRSTLAGEWETIVFDFTDEVTGTPPLDLTASYSKPVVFYNFGEEGAADPTTYYGDNLVFGGVPGPSTDIVLPVTFDDAAIDYEITDFGGNQSMIVADPANASNQVLQSIRTAGAEGFAGTTIAELSGFSEPLPFADGMTTMSVDVWTPVAGTPVRFKVEKVGDQTVSVEVELPSTVGGAWETLVFDFAEERPGSAAINFASTYNKASIFFNFGEEFAAEPTTYYWDNVVFGGTPVAAEEGAALLTAPTVSPNPTATGAEVTFDLALAGDVTVDVVDLLGRRVAVLTDGPRAAGTVRLAVPTAGLPSGVYVVRVRTEAAVQTVRFTVSR